MGYGRGYEWDRGSSTLYATAPRNFLLVCTCWKTAAALAVGNSIVLKMAEQTPAGSTKLVRLALKADFPPGVLNVAHGDGPTTGATLAASPRVPKITFTGSTEVGRLVP